METPPPVVPSSLPSTNFEKWMYYMKDIGSPESYLTFGFYIMIGAALQRRVWFQRGIKICYLNNFCVLVGEPGIGKGQVLVEIKKLLRVHKMKRPSEQVAEDGSTESAIADTLSQLRGKSTEDEDSRLVFPTPADSTSLRALTSHLANAVRRIDYTWTNEETKEIVRKVYSHNSSVFLLEEFGTLIKSQVESRDLVNFLLVAWDCGDYRHSTYHNGQDVIRRMCVSILAGATPRFMQDTFDSNIIDAGFTARCLFIYESRNRFDRWVMSEPNMIQKACFSSISEHLLKLSKLYGKLEFSQDANEYMRKFVEDDQRTVRKNPHFKLDYYYARKDMHLMKLAAAVHFSESISMTIELSDVEAAMELLNKAEEKMHLALTTRSQNKLAPVGKLMLMLLKRYGPKTETELMFELNDEVNEAELREIIRFLFTTHQINKDSKGYYSIKSRLSPSSPPQKN